MSLSGGCVGCLRMPRLLQCLRGTPCFIPSVVCCCRARTRHHLHPRPLHHDSLQSEASQALALGHGSVLRRGVAGGRSDSLVPSGFLSQRQDQFLGFPRIALFMGEKNPFAMGRMMDACLNLPTSIWSCLRGTVFLQSILWVSLMFATAFAHGSYTVCLTPLNAKTIISFLELKFPSPAASFFTEIGSFPSACLVMEVGGKTAWMPWMAALQIVGMCSSSTDWVEA